MTSPEKMTKNKKNIGVGDLIIPTNEYLLERKKTLNIENSLGCIGIVVSISDKGNWVRAFFGLGAHFEVLRVDEIDIVLNMNRDKEENQNVSA